MTRDVVRRSDLALTATLAIWGGFDVVTHRLGAPTSTAVLATALVVLPMSVRRTLPLAALASVGAGLAIAMHQDTSGADADSLAVCALIALYSCGAYAHGAWAWIGLAGASVYSAAAVALNADPGTGAGDYLFFQAVVMGPWLTGYAIRRQRLRRADAELRAARAEAERLAVIAEERARIARELHDVVAHAISLIIVQARAARRVLDQEPEQTRSAFGAIEQAGQGALTEMRRLLVLLRTPVAGDVSPQPTLRDLDTLTGELRGAGLPVDTVIEGTPAELPPAVDLTAYRIVQEALTNALRHAGPARAVVTVRYGKEQLDLDIRDDGRGGPAGTEAGGLAGIRERVSVFGGEMHTDGSDGYRLHVTLPIGGATR